MKKKRVSPHGAGIPDPASKAYKYLKIRTRLTTPLAGLPDEALHDPLTKCFLRV